MLGLSLRDEFKGKRLKGTAIELTTSNNTGATQLPAKRFLEITYPSSDVLKAIEAISPQHSRPLVLIGERGQGKSHLMAVLYHALTDSTETKSWLNAWADRMSQPNIAALGLRSGMTVIVENLNRQHYKYLWDILFDKHPDGAYAKGKWEAPGDHKTNIPGHDVIVEILKKHPTALILDEFQTWYDSLTNTKQFPTKTWAFSFIQLLSEIASNHPELLVLCVSVRNGDTDAYQQIHRVNPTTVDFKGPYARRDRLRLLLHRLFENRMNVAKADIESLSLHYASEYIRLMQTPPARQDDFRRDLAEAWPFAPGLMQLLEDQVLVATAAQETRDLIKILADLFKSRGDVSPVLTAADFGIEDDDCGIASLLSSVSNQHHGNLREKARRNLQAVRDAVGVHIDQIPHLADLVGSLWLRSLAVDNLAGADPATLHADITKAKPIDDNAFNVELNTIVENSFNIHESGGRLVFREEENPQAKLMAFARNDKLFTDGADRLHLAREIRYVIGGAEDANPIYRVVVLPRSWLTDPWTEVPEDDRPDHWSDGKIPLLVVPEDPDRLDVCLGTWLRERLQTRRNTPRFLLPRPGSKNLFNERDLIVLARATMKANEWKAQSPEFDRLHRKFQGELRSLLKVRFNRFALLDIWCYPDPSHCHFSIESHSAEGSKIPDAIEKKIKDDLFIPEDFELVVLAAAANNDSVGKLMRELQEPRPNEEHCIPWLGETFAKEKILRICSVGKIALVVRGSTMLQARPGEEPEAAWNRMKGQLGFGKHLDETVIQIPASAPAAAGIPQPQPLGPQPPSLDGGTGSGSSGTNPPSNLGVPPNTPSGNGASGDGSLIPNLFGGTNSAGTMTHLSAPTTSALNLLSQIERWGIAIGTKVHNACLRANALNSSQVKQLLGSLPEGISFETAIALKFSLLTGAQLNQIVKGLPDGMTYELELDKEG